MMYFRSKNYLFAIMGATILKLRAVRKGPERTVTGKNRVQIFL